MPPLECMIRTRQYNFFKRFIENLPENCSRKLVLDELKSYRNDYIEHYIYLANSYNHKKEIDDFYLSKVKEDIRNNDNYKFMLYKQFNPDLTTLDLNKQHSKDFIRLRLSSHSMPIETGRWKRVTREQRLCRTCKILGDEKHYIYDCPEIDRNQLHDITTSKRTTPLR